MEFQDALDEMCEVEVAQKVYLKIIEGLLSDIVKEKVDLAGSSDGAFVSMKPSFLSSSICFL